MYDIEKYYQGGTVEETLQLLKEHPEAKIICGGSDVLIKTREGKMAGSSLIGIRHIKELQGVERKEDGDIYIGAATTFSHITNDPIIQKYIPVLGEAVDQVGGPQVRNIGTIGGNICNGAVSADSAPTVFSLDCRLRILSSEGERISGMEEFYLGPGKVDLRPGELLTHVIVPRENYEGYTGHYVKYSMRNAMDIATLSCSVVCKTRKDDQHRVLEDIRITFGVAAPVPLRCKETENRLKGHTVDEDLFLLMEQSIREEINPRDSWRASKAFRIQIGGEIAKRALQATVEQQERKEA